MPPWPQPPGLDLPINAAMLQFLRRENPSAHDEVTSVLLRAVAGLKGVQRYCPDLDGYAYLILFNRQGVIFALAFGSVCVALRLPGEQREVALAAGAGKHPGLEGDWVVFEANPTLDLASWCRRAFEAANKPSGEIAGAD